MEVDIPAQYVSDAAHHGMCRILHATEEGRRRLEVVSQELGTGIIRKSKLIEIRKLKAVDFVGVLLALGGTSVFVLGLTWGGSDYPWSSTHVIATLVVGFVVSVGFILWQWKGARYPLVACMHNP